MKLKICGSRGSIPISNSKSVAVGGNTTSIRVFSECLPKGSILSIDAGSGFVPLSFDVLKEGGAKEMTVLFTHYHHDHTQGLLLSPLTFIKNIKMRLCGPAEDSNGPRKMMEDMMRSPYFPVDFKEVASHFSFKDFVYPRTLVGLFHSIGGFKVMHLDEFERMISEGRNIPIGKGKYPVDECLVIRMYKSNHPERTISYRLEERPTGKTFVILTDHENEDGLPTGLKNHLSNADLIIMDSQYSRGVYDTKTAGFGHGTPDYCVRVAEAVGAKKLGLTHHDPNSTDADVEAIFKEAVERKIRPELDIFTCVDYLEIEV
jgi:phosphoribosyl 1,2-cyclic phosphodiesterase